MTTARAPDPEAPRNSVYGMNDEEQDCVVVDAGRTRWRVGFAGEDNPFETWEVQQWPSLCDLVAKWGLRGACFSVGVFDRMDGERVRDIADRCFGLAPSGQESGAPLFEWILIAPQEHMAFMASGRNTGLLVNIGVEITTYAITDGHVLGEMCRRVANPCQPHTQAEVFLDRKSVV